MLPCAAVDLTSYELLVMQLNNQTILEYLNPSLTETYGEKFNRRDRECYRPKLLAVWKFDALRVPDGYAAVE